MNEHFDFLVDKFRNKKVAILCGAGISFNSGAPTVIPYLKEFLKKMEMEQTDIDTVLSANIPFELVNEIVDITTINILKPLLTGMFSGLEPNLNHFLLANLIKKNFLNSILTTNFDTLIEQACLESNVPIDVLKLNGDFQLFDPNKIFLVKIHGCIDFPEITVGNIKLLTSNLLIPTREKVIRSLFKDGPNEVVLILGYSSSDIFDIIPIIKSIESSNKKVYIVNHTSGDKIIVEKLSLSDYDGTYCKFEGFQISTNTDILVNYIWDRLMIDVPKPPAPLIKLTLQQKLDIIFNDFEVSQKMHFCGALLRTIDLHQKSLHYLHIALSKSNDIDLIKKGKLNATISNVYFRLNQLKLSKFYLFESAKIAQELNDATGLVFMFSSLGNIFRKYGKYERSNAFYFKAGEIISKRNDSKMDSDREIASLLFNIAKNFTKIHKYEKAVSINKKAFQHAEVSGEFTLQAQILLDLAINEYNLGNRNSCYEYLGKAKEKAYKIKKNELIIGIEKFLEFVVNNDNIIQ